VRVRACVRVCVHVSVFELCGSTREICQSSASSDDSSETIKSPGTSPFATAAAALFALNLSNLSFCFFDCLFCASGGSATARLDPRRALAASIRAACEDAD
jgi:hypothetical protein